MDAACGHATFLCESEQPYRLPLSCLQAASTTYPRPSTTREAPAGRSQTRNTATANQRLHAQAIPPPLLRHCRLNPPGPKAPPAGAYADLQCRIDIYMNRGVEFPNMLQGQNFRLWSLKLPATVLLE